MKDTEIKELKIDEFIWVVFILLGIANIVGDECKKKYYVKDDDKSEELARKIFLVTLFISLIIYVYISYLRYKRLKRCYENGTDSFCAEARMFASIMVVIASGIFLYCQIKESNPVNPSI